MAGKQTSGADDRRAPFDLEEREGARRWEAGFGDRRSGPPAGVRVVEVRQVHGDAVIDVDDALVDNEAGTAVAAQVEADGIFIGPSSTSALRGGFVAAIRTADCVPVLLVADADGPHFAAAVHAGWRGTAAGIVVRAVERAAERGVDPRRLHARLGPSIGPCCYEVGEEVAARFEAQQLPVLRDGPKPRLDLRALNSILLERAGLRSDRILHWGPCTRCRHDLYWSVRAEPGVEGRQLSWVGPAGPGA